MEGTRFKFGGDSLADRSRSTFLLDYVVENTTE